MGAMMAWFFESTGADVDFCISEHGTFYARGASRQWFTAMTGNAPDLERLHAIETGYWSIHPPIKDELAFDGSGRGLWGHFENAQGKPAGMIKFSGRTQDMDPAVFGVTIFPEPAARQALDLLKMIHGRADWRILLILNFSGFRETGADSPTPTAEEFMREGLFENRVCFVVGASLTVSPMRKGG
jgi:hypothetical protein